MKFLLAAVNAKYIHSNPGIYSLRAYAGKQNQELLNNIDIAEYTINNQISDIVADIYKRKPDVIGFSCYIWNIDYIKSIVDDLHQIMPNLPIWLGGPEVSFDAMEIMNCYPQLTGIMIGEGEVTFYELLCFYKKYFSKKQCLLDTEMIATQENDTNKENDINKENDTNKENSTNIENNVNKENNTNIENNVYKENNANNANKEELSDGCSELQDALGQIKGLALREGYTSPRELTDLSQMPFLYEDLAAFENKIIYYESSRGCPFRCSYCLSSIDKKVRLRDLELVKKELQFFLDGKVKQVKFVDRTFNCNHHHAMEIWQYLYDHDNGITNFHFEVSADLINDQELELLSKMRPGAVQLEIGVQSTNEKTIEAIRRTMNLQRLGEVVSKVKQGNNIHQHLDLIAGLPYENYETFKRSFNEVYAMEPDQLQLGFLKVLKGSYMHEKVSEYGISYTKRPPYEVLSTNWLSYKDVQKLKQIEEMVEIYYNSAQYTTTLSLLLPMFKNPFSLYEALADFYEKEGYFVNTPSRMYRYDVLLIFIKEQLAKTNQLEKEALFEEALTKDIYLRENSKSRPVFAKDLSMYKENCRKFYLLEMDQRKFLPGYEEYDARQMAKMTHIEVFEYDFITGEKLATPQYVLFDYKNRNSLNYDARTVLINECLRKG